MYITKADNFCDDETNALHKEIGSLSLVMPTLFYLKRKDKLNNSVTIGELLSEIVSNI
jgi:hypothetical protein